MRPLRRLSVIDQTAEHIREGLRAGRWSGKLPGMRPLAAELDVSKDTMMAALRILEAEGLLANPGKSRRREIPAAPAAPEAKPGEQKSLRIGLIEYEPFKDTSALLQRMLLRIEHDLEAAGHKPFFAAKSLGELDHDPARIARMVTESPADAWIVLGGEKKSLEWFVAKNIPLLAICGGTAGLPIAAVTTDASEAIAEATRRLVALGHKRIVLIGPRHWRHPEPDRPVLAFTRALAAAGIVSGGYNVPEWDETPEGNDALLESLFKFTPPTALIIPDAAQTVATLLFLSKKGLSVPKDVSIVTERTDQSFSWCVSRPAQFERDESLTVKRVVRWVNAEAQGRADQNKVEFFATFHEGWSIGPASK